MKTDELRLFMAYVDKHGQIVLEVDQQPVDAVSADGLVRAVATLAVEVAARITPFKECGHVQCAGSDIMQAIAELVLTKHGAPADVHLKEGGTFGIREEPSAPFTDSKPTKKDILH